MSDVQPGHDGVPCTRGGPCPSQDCWTACKRRDEAPSEPPTDRGTDVRSTLLGVGIEPAVPDLMGNLRRSLERTKPPVGPRNVNRCTRCLEGEHRRCTGSAGNVGCGCIHAAPVPVPLPPETPAECTCPEVRRPGPWHRTGCPLGEPPAEAQQDDEHQHVWWNGTNRPYYCRTCGEPKPAARPSADTERLRRWITEAVLALDAATTISQRAVRTGRPEGLHTGNHDRLIRESTDLLAALDGDR